MITSNLCPSSNEFGQLEYKLQLALQAATARLKSASSISNPHLQMQFEKRTNKQNILTLDTWIPVGQLFQNGPLSDDDEAFRRLNQTNLIQFPGDSGMAFSTGRLQASQIRNCLAEGATKTLYKMMFCKIAVGRSLAMPSEDEAQRAPLPNGYDSFLIHDQENSRKQDQSSQLYLIKNGSQLLPLYFVQFEFDPELERRSREQPRCDNCETAAAEVHCPADSANLCGACDTKLHSTSKIAQRHRRNPIKRAVDALGCCRHHELQKIEFYCPQCSLAVCVHCKMVGHHSTPETANHRLISVTEAFDTIMIESKSTDPILESRKARITNQIQSVQDRAKQVQDEHAKIKRQLDQIYQRALEKLQFLTNEKMLVLLSDEVELERQQQEIRLTNEFLSYQQTAADAYPLLLNWHKHQQVQKELREFRHFREVIDVELDLKICGELNVVQYGNSPVAKENAGGNIRHITAATQQAGKSPKKNLITARRTSDVFSEVLNIEHVSLVNELSHAERHFAAGPAK